MHTVHAKSTAIASENQILLPKSLVYWYFLFQSLPLLAAILACVLNIARNEWRDSCEMHWYLMNLTLQGINLAMIRHARSRTFCEHDRLKLKGPVEPKCHMQCHLYGQQEHLRRYINNQALHSEYSGKIHTHPTLLVLM